MIPLNAIWFRFRLHKLRPFNIYSLLLFEIVGSEWNNNHYRVKFKKEKIHNKLLFMLWLPLFNIVEILLALRYTENEWLVVGSEWIGPFFDNMPEVEFDEHQCDYFFVLNPLVVSCAPEANSVNDFHFEWINS